MKYFIVLQNVVAFRADWRNLIRPNQYLFLITSHKGISLLSNEQKKCFNEISVSDFEEKSLSSIAQYFIDKYKIDKSQIAVITNDEYSLGAAAKLRENLLIKGSAFSEIEPFINKNVMKKKVKDKIRTPKYIMFTPKKYNADPDKYMSEIKEYLGFPIFAKPIDSAASEGISRIHDVNQLKQWCSVHKKDKNFELDEYIDGDLYHCDCLVKNNKILFIKICKCSCPNADALLGKALGSINLPKNHPDYEPLMQFNQQVFDTLKVIPDGATHLEVFKNQKGDLIFLEIAARAPGGMVPQMYQKTMNANIEELHFKSQMGLELDWAKNDNIHAAWLWFPNKPGIFLNKASLKLNIACEIDWKKKAGDQLDAPSSIRDRAMDILFWDKDFKKVDKAFWHLAKNFEPYSLVQKNVVKKTKTSMIFMSCVVFIGLLAHTIKNPGQVYNYFALFSILIMLRYSEKSDNLPVSIIRFLDKINNKSFIIENNVDDLLVTSSFSSRSFKMDRAVIAMCLQRSNPENNSFSCIVSS